MGTISDSEAIVWGLENRIARQKESIGRLLEHVSFHHDELKQVTAEDCTWMTANWRNAHIALPSHDRHVSLLVRSALADVVAEIERAIAKHGVDRTPLNPDMDQRDAFLCIAEEFGELAHELTYDAGSADRTGQSRSRETVALDAEKEAIQTAAMALAFVVGSRRRALLP
jgi:hypothetical protein